VRIFIVASDEPFYLVPYLRRVIARCTPSVVGMAVHAPVVKRRNLKRSLSMMLLAMLILPVRQWLRLVMWAGRDALAGLGLARTDHHLADVCREFDIPVRRISSVNAPEFVEFLQSEQVDVLFHQSPEILRAPVLRAPRIAVLNRHMSLLPAYRGAWPIFWQLANDEPEVGVTFHIVDEGIDSGAIVARQAVRRERNESMSALMQRLFDIAVPLTCEALARLADGRREGAAVTGGAVYKTPTPGQILRYVFKRPMSSPAL
jgi:folate-dependent phosphoribosylglycinamide formyltransferase PurN